MPALGEAPPAASRRRRRDRPSCSTARTPRTRTQSSSVVRSSRSPPPSWSSHRSSRERRSIVMPRRVGNGRGGANAVSVALRHRTSRTVSLTFIHARSRRRRVDHHRPRRRVATTRTMPTHRARSIVHRCTIRARGRVSSPLPLPPPVSLASPRARTFGKILRSRACRPRGRVPKSRARPRARARRDDVESCQRWHIAAARVRVPQHMVQCTCSLRTNVPCFPARWSVCLSAHDPPRPRRHRALWSFGAGRDSIESPPPRPDPTPGRDAAIGTIGTAMRAVWAATGTTAESSSLSSSTPELGNVSLGTFGRARSRSRETRGARGETGRRAGKVIHLVRHGRTGWMITCERITGRIRISSIR